MCNFHNFRFRALLWLACLPGCALPEPVTYHAALEVGADETVFVRPGLEAAVTRFLGPPRDGEDGPLGPITSDTLSPGSDTPYQRVTGVQRRAEGRARARLRPHLSWAGRAGLGQGRSRYHLPEGAGILTEPIDIRFDTHFAVLEAGVVWDWPLGPRAGTELGLGAGLRHTNIKTAITSPLLAVAADADSTDAFMALRGRFWARPLTQSRARIEVSAEVLAYPAAHSAQVGGNLGLRY